MLKNISVEKKNFLIFLLVHFLVWGLLGGIRLVLPTDTLEGIWWGSLESFGNPKHPPLAGWISYFVYNMFGKIDIFMYLLSQSFIIGGFIFVYKLAKFFVDENKAMLSVIVLEGCWIYSYITGYYGFNPDVVLLLTLPAVVYYFYRSMNINKAYDWIMLGIWVGISCLGKYQTLFVLIPMAIWAIIFNRKTFSNKYFYLAVMIAFVMFSPHLMWLFKHEFMPLMYYDSKLTTIDFVSHLVAPFSFLFMQMAMIAGAVLIFVINKIIDKSSFKINKKLDKNGWFLVILTVTPLVIHMIMGLCSGGNIRPQWGFVFWYLTGIILFYFISYDLNQNSFKNILKSSYIVMTIILLSFGTMLVVEKSYRSRYPVSHVYGDLSKMWEQKYHSPLKYIGGLIDFTYPITIYAPSHPINIMDTYNADNIWIDKQDLKKHGALIIVKHKGEIEEAVRLSCPYLDKNIKIKASLYRPDLVNALGLSRKYKMYYYMVELQK